MQHRQLSPADRDEIARIDDIRKAVFYRLPERPDSRFVKPVRRKRSLEVVQAQGRLRTARWRAENDRQGRATLEEIGKSLAVALATTESPEALTEAESSLVRAMIADLHSRGFSVVESKKTLARLRAKLRAANNADLTD